MSISNNAINPNPNNRKLDKLLFCKDKDIKKDKTTSLSHNPTLNPNNNNNNLFGLNMPTHIPTDNNNHNLENFKTEDLYASLEIEKPKKMADALDFYILPNSNNSDTLNYDKITDLSIKNKLLKINSAMKSFNIILTNNTTKSNYSQLNPTIIDNFLSTENNKNYFINYLLELVIDLIWKIKEDGFSKETVVERAINLNFMKEELEKKNKICLVFI